MPFREIAGHDHLKQLIARAAVRGTLPPSLIFAGPAGVGKAMMALALAQFLNCLAPAEEDACGECASCRRIVRGVHADVLRIEPGDTGSIKIDQIREAIERAAYRPFEGRRRVVIIDHAEQMVVNAQDAILKTLEEPPNASTFILVTDTPDTLLPTIRSRCQRLRFGRLSPGDVAEVLITRHEYAEADAHAAASLSDGSVGRALEGGSEDFVDARAAALQLLETVADDPPPARRIMGAMNLPGASRSKADRDALGQSLLALASILRDLVALTAQADDRALANADLRPKLQRLLRSFDNERSLRAFAAVDRALNALDRNASPKIVADWLSFQI
ncbi:MAG TPA: DNA polymerase III subunit delta' [Vicinamibacterales bacterium]|nr:DNA polymerase III subunit delta' [Vicinamibacterales bacterium]